MTNPNVYMLAIIGFGIIFTEICRYRRSVYNRFDANFFSVLWFFSIYILVPIASELDPTIYDNLLHRHYVYAATPSVSFRFCSAVLLGWASILVGINLCRHQGNKVPVNRFEYVDAIDHARILFLVSLIFVAAFFTVYGKEALTTSIRFGEMEASQLGAFYRQMSTMSVTALLVVFASLLAPNEFSMKKLIIMIPIALVAGFMAVQSGGRGGMLMPFLMCYLLYCQQKKRVVINGSLVIVVCIMAFFILYGRFVFARLLFSDNPGEMIHVLREKTADTSFVEVSREIIGNLVYPFISLDSAFHSIDDGTISYRYFKDIPLGVLFYARLLGFSTDATVSYYNTYAITGTFVSHVPPAIIGLGVYSMGWIGITLVGLAYGVLVSSCRSFFSNISPSSPMAVYKLIAGMLLGSFVASGEPRLLVLKALPIILGLIIYHIQKQVYLRRRVRKEHAFRRAYLHESLNAPLES